MDGRKSEGHTPPIRRHRRWRKANGEYKNHSPGSPGILLPERTLYRRRRRRIVAAAITISRFWHQEDLFCHQEDSTTTTAVAEDTIVWSTFSPTIPIYSKTREKIIRKYNLPKKKKKNSCSCNHYIPILTPRRSFLSPRRFYNYNCCGRRYHRLVYIFANNSNIQ